MSIIGNLAKTVEKSGATAVLSDFFDINSILDSVAPTLDGREM